MKGGDLVGLAVFLAMLASTLWDSWHSGSSLASGPGTDGFGTTWEVFGSWWRSGSGAWRSVARCTASEIP